MISINNLMIGNLVIVDDKVAKVVRLRNGDKYPIDVFVYNDFFRIKITKSVNEDQVKPIEITEEILKKYGFNKEEDVITKGVYVDYKLHLENFHITINDYCSNTSNKNWHVHIDNERFSTICSGDFSYLHELQNTLTLFCNIELKKDNI